MAVLLARWLALAVVGALLGCSTLRVQDYYAPVGSSGLLSNSAGTRCEGRDGYAVTGPPGRILLTRPGVTLGLEVAPVASRTVAAGPLALPVLPALPPGAFPQRERGRGNPVALSVRVLQPADSTELDLDGLVITVESRRSGSRSYEPVDSYEEFVPFEETRSEWRLADGLELTHRWWEGEPKSFRVRISGVVLDGEPVAFPSVSFRKARGWVVCEDTFSDLTRDAREADEAQAERRPDAPAPQPER